MTRISSDLGSWPTQISEFVRGTNPISFFNRICLFDRTSFFDRAWSLEASKDNLREKIQICKEKAGLRGERYPLALETWKKEIVGLAQGIQQTQVDRATLPSQASPKHELVYNHDIAKAATDKELDTLSRNVSTYTTLLLIHNYLGPGQDVDSGVLFELIAQNEKNPQKDVLNMYIEHFSKKMRWGFAQRMWLRCAYWFSSGIISGVIHTTFQNVLAEVRLSTEGKVEPIFENLLDHLEKFLKDYSGEKPLEDFIEKKDLPELCKELAPYLVNEFFPKIAFFKVMFKNIPLMSFPSWILDSTVGVVFNVGLRSLLRSSLPDILQTLAETVEATVLAKLTAKEDSKESPVNYRIAIPVLRFINDKLFGFATMLKEPPLDIDEPAPPRMAAKLEGVINELMKLSPDSSNDAMVREGMRNGLIDGGYQFMKYWQKEQENLLQQVLLLTSLPFTENQEVADLEADRKEFDALWKKQGKLVETVSDRVFDLEAKKYVGTPSSQVMHHLNKEHSKIKRYLEEGLSDIIGLKSSLNKAKEDLKKSDYRGFDVVIGKHLVFWEGFLSLMKSATKKYYPKPASEMLFREFYPLCQEATAQIDQISVLQDEWVLYTRHKELKQHFHEMNRLFVIKKSQDLKLSQVQEILNKIEILLPPNPPEVQILKRFVESFSNLKRTEDVLKDLISMRNVLKKQKQGNLERSGIEEMKSFLLKYPQLQKDKEFTKIYKKYCALCLEETDLEGMSKEKVLLEISKRIEKEIQEQFQIFKDLELNLLHRIYPSRAVSSFSVPIPLCSLVKELDLWVRLQKQGYEILEQGNLEQLQNGTKDLEVHAGLLERKIQKMHPHRLYFPLESVIDGAAWAYGSVGNAPGVNSIKQHLVQDLNGILAGVTPLITAKKEEGKKNLYSWIERLALYEITKYFKAKAR